MIKRADVLVIGGGIAGLTSARALSRAGAKVVVLEAGPRFGGRIRTERAAGWAQPLELGAEFIHGPQPELFALLSEAGLGYEAVEANHYAIERGAPRVASELSLLEVVFAAAGGAPAERSAADFLARDVPREMAGWFRQFVEGFHAAPLERISASSLSEQGGAQEAQYRLTSGYGALVSYLVEDVLAHGGAVNTGWCVSALRRRDGGTEATGTGGVLVADAAVVALPLSILTAPADLGGVRFEPEPLALREAVAHLEMGQALRLVLRFREPLPVHAELPEGSFFHVLEAPTPTFWLGARREEPQLTAWCGGPRAIANDTVERAFQSALVSLQAAFDRDVSDEVLDFHGHAFGRDPAIRGAYPYRTPVAGSAPEPGMDKPPFYFAGDYLEREALGTVGAAVRSGLAAANAVLER